MTNTKGLTVEETDMELSSIEAANFDAMIAEEAILDWLANLESDDTDYESAEADDFKPARFAH